MAAKPSVLLSTTLDPLPPMLRQGLIAVAFFGLLSLISSVALFTFLTYRLAVWYHRGLLKDGANQFLLLIYNLVLAGKFFSSPKSLSKRPDLCQRGGCPGRLSH